MNKFQKLNDLNIFLDDFVFLLTYYLKKVKK